ncbi:uncharacterized protein LOC125563785 [Nematostella vectensis]|uniref:uncharacterized protein LOC125563785 n=1 Tax=Nematostella vectensis TaxID=45351 RepID=UPI00207737F4|nr:uncharacterized protein LOC125563785 [Nematostella vectensis]
MLEHFSSLTLLVIFDSYFHGEMRPALNKALCERRFNQALLFIKSGINVNLRDQDGNSPLLQICDIEPEKLAVVFAKLLVDNGAKIALKDKHGRNAVMKAVLSEKEQLLTLFLTRVSSFNINDRDKKGNTALFYAASIGNFDILRKLVVVYRKFRLSVDVTNKDGITPLIQASKSGNMLCAQHLLKEGKASQEIRDDIDWKTAREWAKMVKNSWLSPLSLSGSSSDKVNKSSVKIPRINAEFNARFENGEECPERPHTAPTGHKAKQSRSQRDELSLLFELYQCQLSTSYRVCPVKPTNRITEAEIEKEREESPSPQIQRRKSSLFKTKGEDIIKLQRRGSVICSPTLGATGKRLSQSFPGSHMERGSLMGRLSSSSLKMEQVRATGRPKPPVRSKSVMPMLSLRAITETEYSNSNDELGGAGHYNNMAAKYCHSNNGF